MTDTPERIWLLWKDGVISHRYAASSLDHSDEGGFQNYIRADIHQAALDEVARLREALTFYADVSDYHAPLTGGMGKLWLDCGQVAREALAATRPEDQP